MWKEKRKGATVGLVAAVFLSGFFARTIDAFRLTKTATRDGQGEVGDATTATVQRGKVLFGADFEKRSDLDSLVRRDSNAEDVQADFAGWPKGLSQDAMAKEATWRRMSPSLQCGGDQMRFRVVGQAASQLALAQGNSLPLPLTNIPSNCGFNMQRNSIGLVMVVPYDGCNVVQQSGTFALPLRFQGIPVLLLCARQALPPFPSARFLPVPPLIDIPPALQVPSPSVPQVPIPQVPLTPPVFQANGFLAHEAFDPRFPSPLFIPSFSQFPTLANPLLHVLAQNPNFYPAQNTLAKQMFPSQANAPLPRAHLPPSQANAPLPRAHLPPGFQPGVGQFQPVPDPGVKPFPFHTHFLPMYPRGFPWTHHLPEESDHWPGVSLLPSGHKPGMTHSQERMPSLSDPKPGMTHSQERTPSYIDSWPGMIPSYSDPWQGNLPLQSDPWPGMIHSQSDPKPDIIPLPETVDFIPPPAQSHHHLHSHPYHPASPPNLPHSHSHHQLDVFPPPNTKS